MRRSGSRNHPNPFLPTPLRPRGSHPARQARFAGLALILLQVTAVVHPQCHRMKMSSSALPAAKHEQEKRVGKARALTMRSLRHLPRFPLHPPRRSTRRRDEQRGQQRLSKQKDFRVLLLLVSRVPTRQRILRQAQKQCHHHQWQFRPCLAPVRCYEPTFQNDPRIFLCIAACVR